MDFKQTLTCAADAVFNYIPKVSIINMIEILIIIFLLYQLFCIIKDTKTWLFVKGLAVFAVLYLLADFAGFFVIKLIFEQFFGILSILLVIIFQQEIRRALGELGKTTKDFSFLKRNKKDEYEKYYSDDTITMVIEAVKDMSKVKTGALILFQRGIPLNEYRDTGIVIDSAITKQMLVQVFEKNTPLHDGALIINNDRIEAATCYLPLSNSHQIDKDLGTRHRAGIGITENTDCVTIIVSEETGKISIALNGKIHHGVTPEKMESILRSNQMPSTMIRKRREKGVRNLTTKLITVFISFVLWIALTNYLDPTITKTLGNIPVEVKNSSVITDQGLSYDILSGSSTDIIIEGRKSVVDNIDETDVFATADLSNLSVANATDITITCTNTTVDAYPATKTLKVDIEPTKEVEYNIEIVQEGSLKSDNYIQSIDLENKSIRISGGESKIDIVGSVKATIDISDAQNDDVFTVIPVVYDKNGNKMDSNTFKLSISETTATIHMCNTKKVPLIVNTYCEELGKGEILNTIVTKEEITIAAEDDILEETEAIIIDVGMSIDTDGKERIFSYTKSINLESYMPEGINCAEADAQMDVEVTFEQYIVKEITMEDIAITGKTRKYQYEVEPITVTIKGLNEDITDITAEQLTPSLDVKGLETGEHNVSVTLAEEYSTYIVGTYSAKIKISEG